MNTKLYRISEEEWAAILVLRRTKLPALDVVMLAREALDCGRGQIRRAKRYLTAGKEAVLHQQKTVTFQRAVTETLATKQHLRARTLSDFRYISRRLLKRCPDLATRRVRSITPAECSHYLTRAFAPLRQQIKARAIMSSIFRAAYRRGWSTSNPVRAVDFPRIKETPIPVLSRADLNRLLQTATTYQQGSCLPAIALMLYAGIRPHEVSRLTWEQIDLRRGSICILPRHSKTGGSRRVTILPRLPISYPPTKRKQRNSLPSKLEKTLARTKKPLRLGKNTRGYPIRYAIHSPPTT